MGGIFCRPLVVSEVIMVFSTPIFVFYFLPLTLLIYHIVPRCMKNVVILLASLFFYFWGEQEYTVIMLLSTVIDFTHGLIVERSKAKGNDRSAKIAVVSSIIFNLGILFFFKYWDFLALSLQNIGIDFVPVLGISLPIGISFYTFQTMSYTIDVYRGDAKAQKNILKFGTFVTLFPQLIAGPIIKYKDIDDQIDGRNHSIDKFSSGVQTFVIGLAKKLLLANNIGQLWEVYKSAELSELSIVGAWLGIIAFSFQIYFDFSGYSDMAIGLGRMFGFEFQKNFNYPYIAASITDFWKRWHISLSSWFREYLYIPLGGNRCKKSKWIFNLLIVWAATGIWHGAAWNYLFWGLYFFVLLIAEKLFIGKLLSRLPIIAGHIYTLIALLVSWTIFAIEDISHLAGYLGVMFGFGSPSFMNDSAGYYLSSFLPMLLIAAFSATPAAAIIYKKLPRRAAQIIGGIGLVIGLLLCTAYLVEGTYNPFLYFRF